MPTILDVWKSTRGGYLAPLLSEPLFRTAFEYFDARLRPRAIILDIGCGKGHATHAFAEVGYRAFGFDVHAPTLQRARSVYPEVPFFAASVERLPVPDESVDALFCFSVLQYVDRARALSECSRVLRRGGHFAFIENLAGNPVAKGYRAWHKLRGMRFPSHLEPIGHLRWRERDLYRTFFSEVAFETYYILTPLALYVPAARRGTGETPATPLIHRSFRALTRAERAVSKRLPSIRGMCWNAVAYGVK